jgi:Secretion system C-terminal sorting domain
MKRLFPLLFLPLSMAAQNNCDVSASSWLDCTTGIYQLNATSSTSSFYSWSPAGNVSNPTIANPTTTIPGTYTVTTSTGIGPNLLTNPDFSLGNTGFSSGHTYTTSYAPCNYYVDAIWFGSFFPGLTDHTPTTDNFFMHIDGCSPATMIWEETVPVTSFTNYIFDFWASRAGVTQPIFEIEFIGDVTGSTIVSTQTGIPDAGIWTWDNYGTGCWDAGPNRNVTIRITNLETAGYGNDFGLDDMSFKVCCSSSAIVTTTNLGQELVTNGDFSAGNTGFNSGHTYTTSYAPCNYYVGSIWFGSFFPGLTDNTPTADNMFMHIDGCNPVTMVWEQTISVSNFTIYNFEFFASKADVTQPNFEVHFIGDVTTTIFPSMPGSPYTGTWEWEKFDIGCWDSEKNSTVKIQVYNLETAGYGNDFGMDDFSFRECCDRDRCCDGFYSDGRIASPTVSDLQVQLMPNPASDYTVIQLGKDVLATQVQIMDATGRLMRSEPATGNTIRLGTGDLPDGIYFIRVMHAGGMLKAVPLTIQH